MAAVKLAERVAELEKEVVTLADEIAQIKEQQESAAAKNGVQGDDWIDKIYGLFADYPDFDQVVELGRKYRESLRPKPAKRQIKKAVRNRKR